MCERTIFANSTESVHIVSAELEFGFFRASWTCQFVRMTKNKSSFFSLFFSGSAISRPTASEIRHVTPTAGSRDDFESSRLLCGFGPFAMLPDEIFEAIDRFRFMNIEFYRRFSDIAIDLARRTANVTKIRVCHFAGAIHNTAHDRNLDAFQVRCRSFDFRRRGLQIE